MAEPDGSEALQVQINEALYGTADKPPDPALVDTLYQKQIGSTDLALSREPGQSAPEVPAKAPEAPALDETDDGDTAKPSDVENMGGTRLADYSPYDELSEDERGQEFDRVFSLADTEVSKGILRAEWPGAEFDHNLAFGEAALMAIPGSLDVLRMLEVVGLADHPDLIRWVASAGRLMATKSGDPNSITTGTQKMTSTMTGNVQAQIDALEVEIDKATALGETDKAQSAYEKQQGLYRLLPGGTDPAYSGGGFS